jgi:hypothetical protein
MLLGILGRFKWPYNEDFLRRFSEYIGYKYRDNK